ncbi:UspA domain protein (plasmid) [Natrialba magadii ATCC 43099]|uniref:UspA domain protein n=1 Tax=Natrialba magadii (strain ATCC 43099 / DSM 3394 / CCM 3739 / CIP 104546 / IAM 13178 / JCM 8861 / NBRC 102185 / NCIMB 2190 / MS3) TaxID=547559 RepID=D3T1T8_NATMM|nr:universal stress protein [Natrialba magadii]ADD07547.1 UspA domain protein [Natrialba magadii ATCC 43099]ELY26583.1 UspA domain-containing protein [Natrialba magadii ATCC 43099]
MGARVLVPYDGSGPADASLRFAMETFPDASIEVLHVVEPFAEHTDAGVEDYRHRWLEKARGTANQMFEKAQAIAEEYDKTVETNWRYGRPGHGIVNHIDGGDFDHVVMGSHGRSGIERIMLGSVAETTLRRSSVPVTIVREQ